MSCPLPRRTWYAMMEECLLLGEGAGMARAWITEVDAMVHWKAVARMRFTGPLTLRHHLGPALKHRSSPWLGVNAWTMLI